MLYFLVLLTKCACTLSCSVMSNTLQPHGLQPTRLFCPWDFLGTNLGVGFHPLLQGIFLNQGLNLYPELAGRFFTIELPGKKSHRYYCLLK